VSETARSAVVCEWLPRHCADSALGRITGACFIDALKQRLIVVDTDFGQVLIDSFLDLMVCRAEGDYTLDRGPRPVREKRQTSRAQVS
jgi:hypothetical protein